MNLLEAFATWVGIDPTRIGLAVGQTLYMVLFALLIGALVGIPLGVLLVLCQKGGLWQNSAVSVILNGAINIVRSVPFVILLIFIMPFTRSIIGTTVGTTAAIVPLTCYIIPYLSRLVEGALLDVNPGILEAAKAMGASTWQTVWHFLLPEAKSALTLALTTGLIGLIGASAMAGTLGGGGVGDLALTYGYQRMNTPLMIVTVVLLIVFVQLIQGIGNAMASKMRKHA